METETTKRKLTWWGINIIVLLYAFIPVVWILTLSLKDPSTLNDGKYFPVSPSWDSYAKIFTNDDFIRALINSIGICLISTFVAIVFGTMAAYAIARLDFPGKTAIVAAALLVSMFPQIALVTPLFKILTAIGLFDTWPGLIIPYVTFALPLAIYTLSAFFREIPWDLEKAAKMDGATPYQAFRQVITPLAMPGVFTTAILVFISCWNDFLFALSLTSTSAARTVPAAMSFFTGATHVREADRPDRRGGDRHHRPDRHLRAVLPATHRRRSDLGCRQGMTRGFHRPTPRGANEMAEIVLDKVVKRYPDGTLAVENVDLEIADGEFVILVGPSGCGKSTTLNMVAGLEDITAGKLLIDGRGGERQGAPKDRDIAMVFQSYALYPHMTVGENMALPAQAGRRRQGHHRRQGREAAEVLELTQHSRPQAGQPVRWPAPAGGHGPGDRAPPQGVPDGRAAVQPGRQAAGADAHAGVPDPEAPAAPRRSTSRTTRPRR